MGMDLSGSLEGPVEDKLPSFVVRESQAKSADLREIRAFFCMR